MHISSLASFKMHLYKTVCTQLYYWAYNICNYNIFNNNHTKNVSGSKAILAKGIHIRWQLIFTGIKEENQKWQIRTQQQHL